ncbi:MAG: hypothetical protein U0570_10695 [Phycisphaerales bacterium]
MAIVCCGSSNAPVALREALSRRGFAVQEVSTTYLAASRAVQNARRDEHGRGIVVLVEPEKLARPHELVRALANNAPSVRCWLFRKVGTGTELRGLTDQDVAAWAASGKAAAAVAATHVATGTSEIMPDRTVNAPASAAYEDAEARRTGGGTPSLRLAGDWGPQSEPATPGDLGPPVLTDEELAMLLGDDPSAAEPGT